jgi:hypothetical protein
VHLLKDPLPLAADSRDRHFPFRKLADEFQLEWEYNESSTHPTLMLAAEVKRYFATAETEAARLRVAEAEEIRRVQEEAATQAKAEQEGAKYAMERARMSARMMRPANPEDYYPPGSVRREEEGSPTVLACVGLTGALLREPVGDRHVRLPRIGRRSNQGRQGHPLCGGCRHTWQGDSRVVHPVQGQVQSQE